MRSQSATDEREQRLLPDEEKVAKADYSYANTGTLEELEQFVGSVMDDLTRMRRLAVVLAARRRSRWSGSRST